MIANDLLNGADAASRYTGLSRRQIYHLVEKGHLRPVRMGRRMFFRKSDLEAAFSTERLVA
jgi:excisionase family DNA binding protein